MLTIPAIVWGFHIRSGICIFITGIAAVACISSPIRILRRSRVALTTLLRIRIGTVARPSIVILRITAIPGRAAIARITAALCMAVLRFDTSVRQPELINQVAELLEVKSFLRVQKRDDLCDIITVLILIALNGDNQFYKERSQIERLRFPENRKVNHARLSVGRTRVNVIIIKEKETVLEQILFRLHQSIADRDKDI